jgi:dCMP deaminase
VPFRVDTETGSSGETVCHERDALGEQEAEAREQKWDKRFLKLAQEVATWSKDPSTKVGCIIVKPNRRVASLGFNGFPHAIADDHDILNDPVLRPEKYLRTVHAEVNAILNADAGVKGFTMYCTFFPCEKCALVIIAAGIKRVVAPLEGMDNPRWKESFEKTRVLFQEAGVAALLYP